MAALRDFDTADVSCGSISTRAGQSGHSRPLLPRTQQSSRAQNPISR